MNLEKRLPCNVCEEETPHSYIGHQFSEDNDFLFDLYNCMICGGTKATDFSQYYLQTHPEVKKVEPQKHEIKTTNYRLFKQGDNYEKK